MPPYGPGHEITYLLKDVSDSKKDDPLEDNKMEEQFRLEIYGRKFEKKVVEQVKAMTLDQLLGNIGGLLGLWLGASMLTILEVFELFVDVISRSMKSDNQVQINQ